MYARFTQLLKDRLAEIRERKTQLAAHQQQYPEHGAALSYDSMFESATSYSAYLERKCAAAIVGVPTIFQLAPSFATRSRIEQLTQTIDQIYADIEGFEVAPMPYQLRIITTWIETMAPTLFGELWNTYQGYLRNRYGWRTPNFGSFVVEAARKEGKTTGAAYVMVLALLNLPRHAICVFAPSFHQSLILVQMCHTAYVNHRRAKDFVLAYSPSDGTLKVTQSHRDIRRVEAKSGALSVRNVCVWCMIFFSLPPGVRTLPFLSHREKQRETWGVCAFISFALSAASSSQTLRHRLRSDTPPAAAAVARLIDVPQSGPARCRRLRCALQARCSPPRPAAD
jgi:hypothetical protein